MQGLRIFKLVCNFFAAVIGFLSGGFSAILALPELLFLLINVPNNNGRKFRGADDSPCMPRAPHPAQQCCPPCSQYFACLLLKWVELLYISHSY